MDPSPDPRSAVDPYAGNSGADIQETADAASDDAEATATPADNSVEMRQKAVMKLLDDEKAEDIVSIDLRGKASYTDFMIIASGRSSRHVGAICEKLIEALKAMGGPRPRAEGVENGDWALIDASDVVVHVFRPEVREFYALEKMWGPSADAAPDEDERSGKE